MPRVLNQANRIIEPEHVGLTPAVLRRFREDALESPSGVVVVTGPTGSGKTSTLHSCVHHPNDERTSIITAEDPVEYRLDGISQCSLAPKIGRTFAESLRHVVRQDPDVIVLGEIRDASSAESAIQAALTGHEVLTTFRTEDAIGALLRLMNMTSSPSSSPRPWVASSRNACCAASARTARAPSCPSLVTVIERKLERGEVELPVFDNVALEVHRTAREGRLDADGLCRILERDATLVSEVLRMANSSFFSGLAEIRDLRQAAVRLGTKQIAAIVMSVSQKRLYSASKGPFRARLLKLSQHSSAVAMGARWVAQRGGYRSLADDAFVAGLLHDVGRLSLLRIIENIHVSGEMRLTGQLVESTLDHLCCPHGARLLELWNVPEPYRHVALHMDDERVVEGSLVLPIVRLVDRVCALEGPSDRPDPGLELEGLVEIRTLGPSDVDVTELRLLIEDLKEEGIARKAA